MNGGTGGILRGRRSAPLGAEQREQPPGAARLALSRAARRPPERAPSALSHGLPGKDSGGPVCQARSIKAAGAGGRKGPVCIRETPKLFSRHSDSRGEGEREPRPRFNRVGSQAVGAPPGQKGLSAGEEAAPGLGGSMKGSCVPAALKFTFVF